MNRSMIQPYFVMSTNRYYKSVVNHMGISHFYTFTQKDLPQNGMIAVPDGCIDILFKCCHSNPVAEMCGSVLQASDVPTDNDATYFGVRFYPGEGYVLEKVQTKEIINNQIPLTDILDADRLFEDIVMTDDFEQRIGLFMNHYTNALRKDKDHLNKMSMKAYMLNKIMTSQGNIKVRDLAREMGYSDRYVNKKFVEYYGMSPKNFCKIIRFQNILSSLNHNIDEEDFSNLLDLSVKAGYYDQSHMIKDFNQLSKHTPTKYLDLLKETNYKKRLIEV